MQTILTDPDHLANYTDRYFTEVVPVDVDDNALAMQGQQAGQAYQQTYDMPAPSAGVAGSQQGVAPQQQWDQFTDVMNRSPENAWRVLGATWDQKLCAQSFCSWILPELAQLIIAKIKLPNWGLFSCYSLFT